MTQHDLAAEVSVDIPQAYQGKDPKVRRPTQVKVQGEKSVHAHVNLILVVSLQIAVACVSVVFRVPLLLLLSAAFLLSGPPGAWMGQVCSSVIFNIQHPYLLTSSGHKYVCLAFASLQLLLQVGLQSNTAPRGWGYRAVEKRSPNMPQMLGSNFSIPKNKKTLFCLKDFPTPL